MAVDSVYVLPFTDTVPCPVATFWLLDADVRALRRTGDLLEI